MAKVPIFVIFLIYFLLGIPGKIVLIISSLLFFGFGLFGPPLTPPDLEYRILALLIAAVYLCVPVLVTKWLIADSPYRFEYWVSSLGSFVAGLVFGASFSCWSNTISSSPLRLKNPHFHYIVCPINPRHSVIKYNILMKRRNTV